MIRLFVIIIFSFLICEIYAQEVAQGPLMTFKEYSHDFDALVQGKVVYHTFEFQNTGNKPLIINKVITSCGCTASEWPREPIAPGEYGTIKVSFNSEGKSGHQRKVITLVTNVEELKTELSIEAFVLPRKSAY